MGTTAQKLQAVANSKAAIKAAIEAKGVSNVGDVLSQYATKIGQISGGGSSGDPRYEVSQQGALSKKSFAVNWFNDLTSLPDRSLEYAYYKSNVTSASFPNLTSVELYGMYNAFYGCTSLTSVDLSSLTTVVNYGLANAFQGCTSLTSVDLSNVTTVGHYGLSNAFSGCTSLTSVDLSSLTYFSSIGGYNSNHLDHAFYGCTSLTSVDLSSLTNIESYGLANAFQGCTSLTTVYLSKLSRTGLNAMGAAFYGCTHLELVDFSKATAVPALSNVNAFSNTNNTYRIVVPNALYDQWIAATNWSDPNIVTHIEKAVKALEFTAEVANSTISMATYHNAPTVSLEYSTDGVTWSPFVVGQTTVTLSNIGDTMYMRAGSGGNSGMGSTNYDNYNYFVMTGLISCKGSILYLLNQQGEEPQGGLPAYCFQALFYDCPLTTAPELPALTIGEGSYGQMFYGCPLTATPELPATSLGTWAYWAMFKGCTGINKVVLPATTLAEGVYNNMFNGCTSLSEIRLGYDGNFSGSGVPTDAFKNWVNGVSSTGTLYYDGTDTTTGTSAIPTGWSVEELKYAGFWTEARQANSTVAVVRESSAPAISLQYSTDDGASWNAYTVGTAITMANVGDTVCFRATTTNNVFGGGSNNSRNKFHFTGQVAIGGNINSLLDGQNFDSLLDISSRDRVLQYLFYGETSLVDAEKLDLHSTKIGGWAWCNMFEGCTNLTKAPLVIPAIQTVGSSWPMAGMFMNTAITKSPYIKTTTITSSAFQQLFDGCSNLNEIKLDYTGSFGSSTFTNWVNGVAASGTFYYNGSYTGRGTNAIPSGWTITPFST